MKFRFRLQPLLDFRKRKEDEGHKELSEATKRVLDEEGVRREYENKKEEDYRKLDSLHSVGATSNDLNLIDNHIQFMEKCIDERDRRIEEARIIQEKKRSLLIEASRERKIIEKLREKEEKAFLERLKKAREKENDDLMIMRAGMR
jgi:flagellar FliJ protein